MHYFYFVILSIILSLFTISYADNKKSICILSISINYKPSQISCFINSLERTKYRGYFILFSDINYNINSIKNIKMHTIKISNSWPFILNNTFLKINRDECILPPNLKRYKWAIYRYSIYYCFLLEYYRTFNYILLLDIRDTIFQLNPEKIKIEKGVYLCEDARYPFKIKEDKWNKLWLLPFFSINDSVFDRIPINGGSIYGESYQILAFHKVLLFNLKKYYSITSDQGIINLIFYNFSYKEFKIYINHNDKGFIYNMGIEIKYKYKYINTCYYFDNNFIHRSNKEIPIIVHQYDRDKELKEYVKRKFC